MDPSAFEEDCRCIVSATCNEKSFGITRSRRRNDFEAGNVREPAFEALRVLRALTPASPNDQSSDRRNSLDSSGHEVPIRGLCDHCIYREKGEFDPLMHDDRAQSGQRSTDGDTGIRSLGGRHLDDAIRAKVIEESFDSSEYGFGVRYSEAHENDAFILLHADFGRFTHGCAECQLSQC
jgi:hypothetical protein